MGELSFYMRKPGEDFYDRFLRLVGIETPIPISDKMDFAIKIAVGRNLDRESIQSMACKELVSLVVLGLVSEGWKVFQPISDPQNSTMSREYRYIQNRLPDQKE